MKHLTLEAGSEAYAEPCEDAGSCKHSEWLFSFSKKLHLRCMVRFASES